MGMLVQNEHTQSQKKAMSYATLASTMSYTKYAWF